MHITRTLLLMTDRTPMEPGTELSSPHASSPSIHAPVADDTPERDVKKTSMLREIVETALLALLIFVLVRSFVLNFKVDGRSMQPSFQNGEMLLVNRNAYGALDTWDFIDWLPFMDEREGFTIIDFGAPERGDVVVFTPPAPGDDKPYIKRVIGLPGDTVEVRDEHVYVNGTMLDEEYIGGKPSVCQANWEYCNTPVEVPEGSVFVMGDNRNNSEDSRYFGPVTNDRIIGKAWVVYWPSDAWSVVDHEDYPELAS
jgi:signal peptidase I